MLITYSVGLGNNKKITEKTREIRRITRLLMNRTWQLLSRPTTGSTKKADKRIRIKRIFIIRTATTSPSGCSNDCTVMFTPARRAWRHSRCLLGSCLFIGSGTGLRSARVDHLCMMLLYQPNQSCTNTHTTISRSIRDCQSGLSNTNYCLVQ